MARKLRTGATLAVLAFVASGCDGCIVAPPTVGTVGAAPSPAVMGQPVTLELAGTGWENVLWWCPAQVQVKADGRIVGLFSDKLAGPDPGQLMIETPLRPAGTRCQLRSLQVTFTPAIVPGVGERQVPIEVEFSFRPGHATSTRWPWTINYISTLKQSIRAIAPPAGSPPPPDQAPTAAFTVTPAAPRSTRQATFDASSSSDPEGAIAAYAWDLDGDGSFETSGGPIVRKTYPDPGTRTVTLRVTDGSGRTATASRQVAVAAPRGPDARFTHNPDPGEMNEPVSFDAGGTTDPDGDAVTAYRWNFGDGTDEVTGRQVQHTYEATGEFQVKLTATDDTGQQGEVTQTITVNDTPARATARAATQQRRARAFAGVFDITVEGRPVTLGRVDRAGGVFRARGILATGTMHAAIPRRVRRRAPAGLSVFANARWAGRFDARAPGAPFPLLDRGSGSGHVLAVSTRSPRTSVCLRLDGKRIGRGRFTVLAGTGSARRLHGSGTVGRRDVLRARTGRVRAMPRPCRTLRRLVPRVAPIARPPGR